MEIWFWVVCVCDQHIIPAQNKQTRSELRQSFFCFIRPTVFKDDGGGHFLAFANFHKTNPTFVKGEVSSILLKNKI